MKIRPVGAKPFHEDGQTDTHDEANSRFSQFVKVPRSKINIWRQTTISVLRILADNRWCLSGRSVCQQACDNSDLDETVLIVFHT